MVAWRLPFWLLAACGGRGPLPLLDPHQFGLVVPRATTLHGAEAVTAFYPATYGDIDTSAWGARIGGDLLATGQPSVVIWGSEWPNQVGEVFISVYPPDLVGERSLYDDPSWRLVSDAYETGRYPSIAVIAADVDASGDGAVDLVATTDDDGIAYVFRGPLAAGATFEGADTRVHLAGEYVGESWKQAADIDGDGIADLLVEEYAHDTMSRVSVMLGPLAGELSTQDADAQVRLNCWQNLVGEVRETWSVLACYRTGWVIPTAELVRGDTAPGLAVAEVDMSDVGEIEAVELEEDVAGADYRVWAALPTNQNDDTFLAGAVYTFAEPQGTVPATDAEGTAWGKQECGMLGVALAHADNYDGAPGMWIGEAGAGPDDIWDCGPGEYGLYGVVSPMRGRVWADELDDSFVDVWVHAETGSGPYVAPVLLDVGDLDGTGRDDLVSSGTSGGVVVVSW